NRVRDLSAGTIPSTSWSAASVTVANRAEDAGRQRCQELCRVPATGDSGRLWIREGHAALRGTARIPRAGSWGAGFRCEEGSEQSARWRGGIVGDDRVVDQVDADRILQGDAAAIPTRNVVGNDVVGYSHRVPTLRIIGEGADFNAVDPLEANAATAAGFGSIAHNQVGVDEQVTADAIARASTERQGAIGVLGAVRVIGAGRIGVRRVHDQQTAAVARSGWVCGLIEQDHVVLDLAIPNEAHVGYAGSIARAQVAANPVVVELVVVGTGAEGNPTCATGAR